MAATGPVATGMLSQAAAPAANTAFGGSLAPVAQPHGTDDSRASVSRRPEDALPACHMPPHAAGSNAAAWAVPQPDQAQPALPGWPGLLGADQLVTLCIKVGMLPLCSSQAVLARRRELQPRMQFINVCGSLRMPFAN